MIEVMVNCAIKRNANTSNIYQKNLSWNILMIFEVDSKDESRLNMMNKKT